MTPKKSLERIILSAKPNVRKIFLADLAVTYGFTQIEPEVFKYDNEYLLLNNHRITYLTDFKNEEYSELKKILEHQREKDNEYNGKIIQGAFSLGGSAIGGGALGYFLVSVLHWNYLVLIPCITVPLGLNLYDIIKTSSEASKTEAETRKALKKYDGRIHHDYNAIKIFNEKLFNRVVRGNS